jgi:hypothetical protein
VNTKRWLSIKDVLDKCKAPTRNDEVKGLGLHHSVDKNGIYVQADQWQVNNVHHVTKKEKSNKRTKKMDHNERKKSETKHSREKRERVDESKQEVNTPGTKHWL